MESLTVDSHGTGASLIIVLGMLMLYMIFEAQKHARGWRFGHEASFITTVGFIISGFELLNKSSILLEFND